VAGALAERDFVEKLEKAGLTGVEVLHREPVGVEDCALYPLFTDDLIELMRTLIPQPQQEAVAFSIVVRAERRARPGSA
jgi:arsenite methyltransferase